MRYVYIIIISMESFNSIPYVISVISSVTKRKLFFIQSLDASVNPTALAQEFATMQEPTKLHVVCLFILNIHNESILVTF